MASILIIHSGEHLVSCFRRNLEAQGHQVRVAADAERGQALARQDAPDLIICDGTLDLPELPASSRILRVVPRGRPASGQAVALPFRPSELNLHV